MNNMKLIIKVLAGTMIFAAAASQATELVKVETNNNFTFVNEISIELTQSFQAINIQPVKVKESAKIMLITHSNNQLPSVEANEDTILIATAD